MRFSLSPASRRGYRQQQTERDLPMPKSLRLSAVDHHPCSRAVQKRDAASVACPDFDWRANESKYCNRSRGMEKLESPASSAASLHLALALALKLSPVRGFHDA